MQLPTELGPKMQACSEQEQRFVWAFLEQGCADASEAARKAGYSDPGPHSSTIRVRGHELRHRRRVVEAMQEVARSYFGGLLLPAVLAAEDMITNPKHPDHAKMVLAALSAQGLGASQTIDVNHTVTRKVDASEAMAKIAEFREKFPLQFAKMIGAGPAVIEAEFSEVADADQA